MTPSNHPMRVVNEHTLYDAPTGTHCQERGFNHQWRTVECDGETDVVECAYCGDQHTVACNFDEEYS